MRRLYRRGKRWKRSGAAATSHDWPKMIMPFDLKALLNPSSLLLCDTILFLFRVFYFWLLCIDLAMFVLLFSTTMKIPNNSQPSSSKDVVIQENDKDFDSTYSEEDENDLKSSSGESDDEELDFHDA